MWKEANEAKSPIPADRLQFYSAAVLTMITINREEQHAFTWSRNRIVDAQDGRQTDAEREAQEAVNDLKQVEALQKQRRVRQVEELVSRRLAYQRLSHPGNCPGLCSLSGIDPLTPLPPPLVWTNWEAYYHIMRYETGRPPT